MNGNSEKDVEAVERAMVGLRRSMNRRTLARLAEQRGAPSPGGPAGPAVNSAAFDVLDALEAAEQAGAPATVSSVAAALNIDQPRASKLVAAVVAAGLVRREADQADGRRALLVRTAMGRALSDEVHRFRRAMFSAAMSDWPDADRADFARLLTRFVDALSGLARQEGV